MISRPHPKALIFWKATKEYLNQRGTKIRVFRVCFRTPFLPPFFPHFSPLFPLQALCILAPLLPSSPPPSSPLFLAPGKVRFRYPSDLGTLWCPAEFWQPRGASQKATYSFPTYVFFSLCGGPLAQWPFAPLATVAFAGSRHRDPRHGSCESAPLDEKCLLAKKWVYITMFQKSAHLQPGFSAGLGLFGAGLPFVYIFHLLSAGFSSFRCRFCPFRCRFCPFKCRFCPLGRKRERLKLSGNSLRAVL